MKKRIVSILLVAAMSVSLFAFLDENAKNINIEDHIDTSFYEEALNEATEEYGDENPEFYSNLKSFYEEHNK